MSEPKPIYLPFYADAHEWDAADGDDTDPAIVFTGQREITARPWTAPVFVGRPANALESIIAAVLRRLA